MNMHFQRLLSKEPRGKRVASRPAAIVSSFAVSALEFRLQPARWGSAIVVQLRSLKAELQIHCGSVDRAQTCLLMAAFAFILPILSSCATTAKIAPSAAPYDDINEVPDAKFVRAYLRHLVANDWANHKGREVLISGAVKHAGYLKLQEKTTIEGALRKAQLRGGRWTPSFFHVALWRAREGMFYGVVFPDSPSAKPKAHMISSSTVLEPDDAVIALEKMVAF